MFESHVYILHGDDKIKSREDVFCDSDEAAKKQARRMVDRHAIELWQEARKIARFAPET